MKRNLYNQLRIEEYESTLNQTEDTFTKVWDNVYDELMNLFSKQKMQKTKQNKTYI